MATQRRPGLDPDMYGPPREHRYGQPPPLPPGPEESPGPPGTQDVPTLPPPGPGGEVGPIPARGGSTPRESEAERQRERVPDSGGAADPGGGPSFAPRKPSVPTPQAGIVQPQPGPIPFNPMDGGGMSPENLAKPLRLRGFYGSQGGLTGGGFGLPFDPISNQDSDPISSLIEQLMKSGKVRF